MDDPARWTHRMGAAELDDLRRAADALRGRSLSELRAEQLPTTTHLTAAAARWRRALEDGPGFVLVRGVDVDASPEELELRYAILGLHVGTFVSQNRRGELLTHIRDTGADPHDPSTRLYTTRAEQEFHTDGADIIGLLCRRTARAGGVSRIVSSGAVVAEIARTRPDLYPALFTDFPWHYQEAGMPRAAYFERPICVAHDTPAGARLNVFFIPWFIARAQQLGDAPRLTEPQAAVVALVTELANAPRFYLDMAFEPGDVQWIKNAAILHKRTAYEDFDEPDQKRHLLRLWLNAPDSGDGDPKLRAGILERAVR